MQWLSKQSLLIAFFFVFSFNHIVLTKYHFVLGQASFYCIAIALLTGYFPVFKAIPKRSLHFFGAFLIYCLGSASFFAGPIKAYAPQGPTPQPLAWCLYFCSFSTPLM